MTDLRRSEVTGNWFAWRPVRLSEGGWAWLRTLSRTTWFYRCGDHLFPGVEYALLP